LPYGYVWEKDTGVQILTEKGEGDAVEGGSEVVK